MIKKFLILITVVFSSLSFAQQGSSSPYSFYGIGSLKFKGTVENQSMGGLSVYSDSIHINLRNPASYAGENLKSFNSESRPIKYTVGGSHMNLKLNSSSQSDETNSSSVDYLAISIPLGKFGAGFGLLPFSSVPFINKGHDVATFRLGMSRDMFHNVSNTIPSPLLVPPLGAVCSSSHLGQKCILT